MNSKDRMAAAMGLCEPDRVPVMCQLSLGYYFLNSGIPEVEIWHSTDAFGEALIELQRRFRFDGILINLPGRNPNWRSYARRVEDTGEEKIIDWTNGWYSVCPRDDNPHVYRQNGERYFAKFEEIEPERLFYVEPHDLSGVTYPHAWGFVNEIPEREFPPWQFDTIDYVVSRAGKEVSVHGEIFSPFTQFLELLDYTNGLTALMDDPVKCEDCLAALAEGAIVLGRGQAAHGVDAILISSPFAGAGFISPDHYRRFVLRFEKMVIDGIKAECDIPVYTHTCGSVGDRLELMGQTGAQGLDTLDPPPLGNVELADAKERIGKRMFIKGNIDAVNVISNGTPEQVLNEAKRCIEVASPGGGYILSSACSIPPVTPAPNISKLVEAAERFGYYEDYEAGSTRIDSESNRCC
jgi:MtaA/CmuA family methyltransferase